MTEFDEESFGIIPVFLQNAAPLYLLIQHHHGHWGFPKGNPESGEEPQESAVRELQEETGIEAVEILDGFKSVETYWYKRKGERIHKRVTYFLGVVSTTETHADEGEVAACDWLPYSAARRQLTYDQAKETLKEAKEYLAKDSPPPRNVA